MRGPGQVSANNRHPMQIRDFESADLDGVHRLLVINGWAHRIPDAEHLQRIVRASQRNAVALLDGEVVGFARAITDGLSNGYLSMVVVAEAQRRQGVGKALVQRITGSEPGITWILRAGRQGASEFFATLGFVASTDAMERLRR